MAATAALTQQVRRMPGLWLGTLRLCGLSAEPVEQPDHGIGTVIVTLPPRERAALARETRARVGYPLAIRLNGRELAAPIVREPIEGGIIAISAGRSSAELQAQIAPALRTC
jgi:preprotein translocase subunit SecD